VPTQEIVPSVTVRIAGDLNRAAAVDLMRTLQLEGWEAPAAFRPKHGAPEVLVALSGLAVALTALLKALPGVLAEWGRRHQLREFEVTVKHGGEEVRRIAIRGRSDADTLRALSDGMGDLFGADE